jgi:putative intracellular protease/amidase/YHS domain-containing protein
VTIVGIAEIICAGDTAIMKPSFLVMKVIELIHRAVRLGVLAALILCGSGLSAIAATAESDRLSPPAKDSIPVAFLISEGAVVIDFTGPWEVFQDVNIPSRQGTPFRLYTVAETTKPIRTSGGMQIIPDYSIANAPAPKVIVIPAQNPPSEAVLDWIRKSSRNTDVTMSVCTGAFILARTGLLNGKSATTWHGAFARFEQTFPDIQLKRGARFVENGRLATAGGLSSGIDLALRVVERYYGREVAQQTAYTMEYQGEGWMNPDSNRIYAEAPVSTAAHPVCTVCGMDVDPKVAPKVTYRGTSYYFCSENDKKTFESDPDKFVRAKSKQSH